MIGRSLDVDVGQAASRRPPSDPGPAAAGLARPGFLRAFKFRGMHLPRASPGRLRQPLPVTLATFRRGERARGWVFVSWPPASASTARSRISFQNYRLPRKKKREKKNPQMPHKCVGQSGIGHARWNYDFYRRRPTPACAGVGRQISRIFPAPIHALRVRTLYTGTEPTSKHAHSRQKHCDS